MAVLANGETAAAGADLPFASLSLDARRHFSEIGKPE
jgi:hypothetical protein